MIMRDPINRRNFLKKAATAGLGLGVANLITSRTNRAWAQVSPGANNKLTVAVIGTNGRGMAHIECLTGLPGIEISYICDVDDRAIAKGIKAVTKQQKTAPKGLKDF